MRLINKKTGEIRKAAANEDGIYLYDEITEQWWKYGLELLASAWEYYVEPEEVWYIDYQGVVRSALKEENDWFKENEIGNCFETKEEAEKAVEKLKAWKRLKGLGFRFIGETCDYKPDKHFGSVFFETNGYVLDIYEDTSEFYDDLELLFGGEE